MGLFELANRLAVAIAGDYPQWTEQSDYEGAPTSAAAGRTTSAALRTEAWVQLREEAHRRTSRVTVETFDAAANYTTTIDGNPVVTAGDTDIPTTLQAMADDINADATVGALVTASLEDADGDGIDDTLVIVGDAEADYSIDIAATGTGVLACEADPTSADARLWVYPGGPSADARPSTWVKHHDVDLGTLDYRGTTATVDTARYSRVYVELSSVAGPAGDGGSVTYAPSIRIGPSVRS